MLSAGLQHVHPNVLAKMLKQATVYQNEEIVVINKPYGLPVHGEGQLATSATMPWGGSGLHGTDRGASVSIIESQIGSGWKGP